MLQRIPNLLGNFLLKYVYILQIYIYTYIQGMAQLRISSSTVHASYIEKKNSTIICRATTATILNYF